MAKITFYAISCSADSEIDVRRLYVWGEWDSAKWLPTSKEEAKRRIKTCREKNKCQNCDGQIHKVIVERTKKTYGQEVGNIKGPNYEKEKWKESAGKLRKACEICGKQFWVYKSQASRKYCSLKCSGKGRRT